MTDTTVVRKAAPTVRSLEAELMILRQMINGVSMTLDKRWADQQQEMLKLKQEVQMYFQTINHAPQQPSVISDPWRLPIDEFLKYQDSIEADWSDHGNIKVAKRLAQCLKRSIRHAEGQLYINWTGKAGRELTRAYWMKRGFDAIPDGL